MRLPVHYIHSAAASAPTGSTPGVDASPLASSGTASSDELRGAEGTRGARAFASTLFTRFAAASAPERAAAKGAELAERWCVWFAVGLRGGPIPDGGRGGADSVVAIPGFWADIDVAHPAHQKSAHLPPDRAAARAIIRRFPVPPTYVVDTGHGLQAYWLFKSPLALRTPEDRARAQPFVEQQAAFDRFARSHLGLDGQTLMRAWGFPGADDLAATLIAYRHVRPREDEVAALAAGMADAWKRRLGRDIDPADQE